MNDKQLVAIEASKLVKSGMLVGLGTGSTANYFIEALAQRQREEALEVTTVASSTISAIKARDAGLNVVGIEGIQYIDVYVDGADEITPDLTLLKGRGQDLVMEKLLAKAAKLFVVVADSSKCVQRIGDKNAIPIEVMPAAWQLVKHCLEKAGGSGQLRLNATQDNVALSAQGHYVLDMRFPSALDDYALHTLLNNTPGVAEHGVFYRLAHRVILADQGQISELAP